MAERHTRGPWVAMEIGQGGPADAPMPIYEIHTADGHAVIAEYVDEKNATILAAAPTMFEALQTIVREDPGGYFAAIARAAFTKAAPEQQEQSK